MANVPTFLAKNNHITNDLYVLAVQSPDVKPVDVRGVFPENSYWETIFAYHGTFVAGRENILFQPCLFRLTCSWESARSMCSYIKLASDIPLHFYRIKCDYQFIEWLAHKWYRTAEHLEFGWWYGNHRYAVTLPECLSRDLSNDPRYSQYFSVGFLRESSKLETAYSNLVRRNSSMDEKRPIIQDWCDLLASEISKYIQYLE